MANNQEAPLAQGLDEIQDHIEGMVPYVGHSGPTEVATYLPSGGIERIPLLAFLEEQASAQAAGTSETREMLRGGGVSLVRPETESEQNVAEILTSRVRVSPALARVLRVYVPQPSEKDNVLAFERRNTVFVPSKW